MQTPFLGLRTTIYKVADLPKARDWYSRVLRIEPYFNEPFYVGFNVAGYELGLQPDANFSAAGKTEGISTYWGVADVARTYDSLLELGATPHETPREVGGGIVVATVKDPWGNLFGIIYNPHFQLP
jgi:lactoylglutathione lyase